MRKLIGLFLLRVLFRDPAKIVLRFLREEERRAHVVLTLGALFE